MKRLFFLALLFAVTAQFASADENSDLDLIPKAVREQKSSRTNPRPLSRCNGKAFIEESLSAWNPRDGLNPAPPVALPSWQSLTDFDLQGDCQANERGPRLHLSDRLNFIYEDDITYPSQDNFRNDLRELYFSRDFAEGHVFLQAGRINTRHGVALGFNPTDFFKTRSAVLQSSIDPSLTRENRLGVFQAQAQALSSWGSMSLIAVPGLESTAPLMRSEPSLSLRLGETNSENRFLATASVEVLDFSPQFLVYHDSQGERFGLNASHGVGSSVVLYGEWAGGRQLPLAPRALKFAENTGSLPPLPLDLTSSFQNDLAIGGSWTSSRNFTINLEYHFHEAGLTYDNLRHWLQDGAASPLLGKEFWLIRQYAGDQQEPLTQNQIFVRLSVPDFFWSRHELDAVAFINPEDGSTTAQLASLYLINDSWSMSVYWTTFLGSTSSERGSLPFQNVFAAKLGRYF